METEHTESIDHGQQAAIMLPRWFVWLSGICFAVSALTIMPWVVWQTTVTMRLEIQMETIQKIESKIDKLVTLDSRLGSLERRFEIISKIEDRILHLEREARKP